MSAKRKLPQSTITAAAEAFAAGTATRRTLQALGLPQRQYPAIAAEADEELKRFRHALSGVLAETIMDLTERLRADSGKLSVGQIPVTIGILADKHRALNDTGGPISQHVHLHLADGDRHGAIAALLGKHAERSGVVPEKSGERG